MAWIFWYSFWLLDRENHRIISESLQQNLRSLKNCWVGKKWFPCSIRAPKPWQQFFIVLLIFTNMTRLLLIWLFCLRTNTSINVLQWWITNNNLSRMKNSDIIIAVLQLCSGNLLTWGKTPKENFIFSYFLHNSLSHLYREKTSLHVCSWTNRFNLNLVLGSGCYLFHTADFYCCF